MGELPFGEADATTVTGTSPAEMLRKRLVDELRDRLLEQGEQLPLRNHAALRRVVTLCRDPNGSARGVAVEAARDEAFAALLLRVANSAYSASVSRIGTLTQAVARLGFDLVQGLALATMGAPGIGFTELADGPGESLRELHRHSVRTGIVARALAGDGLDSELALTAGLLHNLGLSVTALFAPKAFRSVMLAAERGEQLGPVEEDVLGFTHAELGAMLASRWAYPPELVQAIAEHDADEPSTQLAALIQVADLAVRTVGIGIESPVPVRPEVARLARVELDVVADRLAPLLAAQERLEQRMAQELEKTGELATASE